MSAGQNRSALCGAPDFGRQRIETPAKILEHLLRHAGADPDLSRRRTFADWAAPDNVFIERLWRSLKYEDVYLKGYADGRDVAHGIAEWVAFYNERHPHQALADRSPMAVWRQATAGVKAVDMMDNASDSCRDERPQPQQRDHAFCTA